MSADGRRPATGAHLGAAAWPAEWAGRIEYREELLGLGALWDGIG